MQAMLNKKSTKFSKEIFKKKKMEDNFLRLSSKRHSFNLSLHHFLQVNLQYIVLHLSLQYYDIPQQNSWNTSYKAITRINKTSIFTSPFTWLMLHLQSCILATNVRIVVPCKYQLYLSQTNNGNLPHQTSCTGLL